MEVKQPMRKKRGNKTTDKLFDLLFQIEAEIVNMGAQWVPSHPSPLLHLCLLEKLVVGPKPFKI